jgi:hypothetical protein
MPTQAAANPGFCHGWHCPLGGADAQNDELNVVWVVDSGSLPFYQAETYHQFHNGIGKKFPQVRCCLEHTTWDAAVLGCWPGLATVNICAALALLNICSGLIK